MRDIHTVLSDETSASILAQITMDSEGISASSIAKNINIPQSTVYDHLRMLEKDKLIYSEETKIRNFIKKVWFRTEKKTFPDTEFVTNKEYKIDILTNKNDIGSRIRFAQALARKSVVTLEKINDEEFAKIQKNSSKPVFLRQLIINEDDYQFVLKKLVEIEKELEKRNKETMEDRGTLLKEEKYLIFYYGLPDLQVKEKK